jgi:hypothetical protein
MNFFVGGRYISASGNTVRTIERIHGDNIYWRDDVGPGQCGSERFKRWVGALSPDSPVPLSAPKRAKRVTEDVIVAVKKELSAVQLFRSKIADIKIETEDPPRQELIGFSIGLIGGQAQKLEQAIQDFPGFGKRLLAVTRMDDKVDMLQNLISTLKVGLTPISESSSQGAVTQLRQVLSDGSDSLARLRRILAPCIGQ